MGFLWLPRTLNGITRWLEVARWKEVRRCHWDNDQWIEATEWLDLS
jgi:hypothetical protein